MNFFNFDLKKIFVLAILVSIPLFSVNMQQQNPNRPWILEPFYFLAAFTQNSYAGLSSGVRETTRSYLNLVETNKKNHQLDKELAELRAQLGALTELKLENERLNKLLDFKQKANMNLMAARVIGRDLLTEYDTVTIDRGEDNGVKKGMGVITIAGVVGYAIEVEAKISKILLLTDRYAVIDGIVQRSRARGIVQGQSKDSCALTFLKRTDDIKDGDRVVTSGIDNYFPKGFPIGEVSSVKKDEYGLGQDVVIQPIVSAANLEEVFVILNANNQDFERVN